MMLAILPTTALDSLTYFGWLWLFEPPLVPKLYIGVFVVFMTYALQSWLPWVRYSVDGKSVYRIRKDTLYDGDLVTILLFGRDYIEVMDFRLSTKGNAIDIQGDYEVYRDGDCILIQNPDEREIDEMKKTRWQIKTLEKQLQWSEWRNMMLNTILTEMGVRVPDHIGQKSPPTQPQQPTTAMVSPPEGARP